MTTKTAIPHKHDADMVLTSDRGSMSRAKALRLGYAITDQGANGRQSDSAGTFDSWRLAIECLPESRERASATAELIANRNPETLTVEQARSFLRGLPTETTEQTETTETMTTDNDPRAARLTEINASMAAFNRSQGRPSKPQTKAQPTAPSNVEPAKLKRLAEIRLNALHMNGHANTQEYKTLRLAIETHDRVGTPLNRVFAQLGVDVSKFAS